MKLINPQEIRSLYAVEHNWLTAREIAKGTNVALGSVSNALNGKPVRPATIKKLAAPLNRKPTEIAKFIESE